jgi:hypothetical protein
MPTSSTSRPPESTRLHWNYFLALEKDMEVLSRYIEFSPDNFNTYSIELAHLLLSAASEVDTLAKCICSILDPKAKPENINEYRRIIKAGEDSENDPYAKGGKYALLEEEYRHRLSRLKVYVPRYSLEFAPWADWAKDENPDWWHSYNNVKHERNHYFNKATLGNALQALAALLAVNYLYCRLDITKTKPDVRYQYQGKNVTRHMQPESTLLRFSARFYDNPIAELGGYISSVSEDVGRLERHIEDARIDNE